MAGSFELIALLGREDVEHRLAAGLAGSLDLRTHRLKFGFHIIRFWIVGLFQRAELLQLRMEIGVELMVLLAAGGMDILQLLFLRVGEIEFRGHAAEAGAMAAAVQRSRSGRLRETDRRGSRDHQCNDKLFHDV